MATCILCHCRKAAGDGGLLCQYCRDSIDILCGGPMNDPTPKKPDNRPAAAKKPKAPTKSKRERWNSLYVKRVKNARRALRNVARMGNVAGYEYTPEEAAQVIAVIRADCAEVERAFKGAPKEKGLFDL